MSVKLPHAMSFEAKGIRLAMQKSLRYAGSIGRLATMPDIANAGVRGCGVWGSWITTATCMHTARTKHGTLEVVVSHGFGPLFEQEVLSLAYKENVLNCHDDMYGGIDQREYNKVKSGDYGEVDCIELTDTVLTRVTDEHCVAKFRIDIRQDVATDPLAIALFGSQLEKYVAMLKELNQNRNTLDIKICIPKSGYCSANLMVLEGYGTGVDPQENNRIARFVAVRDGSPIKDVIKEVRAEALSAQIRKAQSEFDKLRHEIDLLELMEEAGLR